MRKLLAAAVALAALVPLSSAVPQPAGGNKIDFGTSGSGCCNAMQAVQQLNLGANKQAPLTGATITIPASGPRNWLIVPSGTIATLTITLPQCAAVGTTGSGWTYALAPTIAADGTEFLITFTQTVTALTLNAAGSSSMSAGVATAGAAGTGHLYHCHGADTTWYQF